MCNFQFIISQFQDGGFLTLVWTWLVLFLSPLVTFSRSLIVQPDGQKQSLFNLLQQRIFVKVLLQSWIPLIGVPSVIPFDCGMQFTSSFWSSMCKFLGIIHSPTAQSFPSYLTCMRVWLVSSSTSGVTQPTECSERRFVYFTLRRGFWLFFSSTLWVPR